MSWKEHFREGMATPSGVIPYGDKIEKDGVVYSIDKFRPRFRLAWGRLAPRRGGVVIGISDGAIKEWVEQTLLSCYSGVLAAHGSSRSSVVSSWRINDYLIILHKFTPFHAVDPNYSLLVEFNPNKVSDGFGFIKKLIETFKLEMGEWFAWDDTRTDFTIDIDHPITDVRLLSRKSPSSYMGTYYFGKRGESGYTRVYNKRQELIDHYDIDIGREVTRIEYESRSGYPVNYDVPYLIGDLGKHEVLRFVPMDSWPAALRTFDPKTAKKIKEEALYNVPFDSTVFHILYDRLLSVLALPAPSNVEGRHNRQVVEDIELISSELHKFAKNID